MGAKFLQILPTLRHHTLRALCRSAKKNAYSLVNGMISFDQGGVGQGSGRRLLRKMVLPVSPWSACFLMWYAQRIFGDIFGDSKNSKKIGQKIICWTPYPSVEGQSVGGCLVISSVAGSLPPTFLDASRFV
jgi:hypothetical protein